MKQASSSGGQELCPPIPVEPDFLDQLYGLLEPGETIEDFIVDAVRQAVGDRQAGAPRS
jgi:hypothetical protein